MKKNLLVILTKYPETWKVKTRLAKKIWFEKSAMIQELFIKNLLKNNYNEKHYDYEVKICLKEREKIVDFIKKFWIRKKDIFFPKWTDLWKVMSSIFEQTLLKYEKVILIWSDIPLLNKKDFFDGFNKLENNNFVIWKAIDWWYYLIWMKQLNTYIFENIEFSTSKVFEKTISKIKKNNHNYWLINEKRDIDEYEDLIEESKNDKTWFFKKIIEKINEK